MMTREEAISIIERVIHTEAKWPGTEDTLEALDLALSALRPVSREQVEKVWPECDCCEIPCDNCKSAYKWDTHGLADECVVCRKSEYKNYTPESQFCEFCGRPLTDEAVDILLKRLEELHGRS